MNNSITTSLALNEHPYCIQCQCIESGKTGSFLYDRVKKLNGEGLHAISPVFSDTLKLFEYCRANNLKPVFLV